MRLLAFVVLLSGCAAAPVSPLSCPPVEAHCAGCERPCAPLALWGAAGDFDELALLAADDGRAHAECEAARAACAACIQRLREHGVIR